MVRIGQGMHEIPLIIVIYCNADDLKKESPLLTYTCLLRMICKYILFDPKSVTQCQEFDQLVRDAVKVLGNKSQSVDVSYLAVLL